MRTTFCLDIEHPRGAGKPVYPLLHGGRFSDDAHPQSPDPLRSYRWAESHLENPLEPLQCYYLRPVAWNSSRDGSFASLDTLSRPGSRITVEGTGSLRVDFGVESAGWLEFEAPDFNGTIELSVSENNEPGEVNVGAEHPSKTLAPVLEDGTWRLKLNKEYYEGVRFGWLHVRSLDRPFVIHNLRCACQVKPVNYKGSFSSDNPLFDRIWETAAYSVRLNFLESYIGAILNERSDRFSWTGDAYTSQMAALYAFSNFAFIRHNLERTSQDTNNIASYSLYWIASLLDYVWFTGDLSFAREKLPLLREKLQASRDVVRYRANLVFMGHDDRLGAAFEQPNILSNHWNYALLHLRACRDLIPLLSQLRETEMAAALEREYRERLDALNQTLGWPRFLSLHSAADAINAGVLSKSEEQDAFDRLLANRVNRISYSPFNQYFILEALARIGRLNDACDAAERCWGGMLALGATSFWESYRPEWNAFLQPTDRIPNGMHGYTSYCHPWSSGVLRWMQEHLAGFQPLEPGWSGVRLAPADQSFVNRIDAMVETPSGTVRLQSDFEAGVFEAECPGGEFIVPWRSDALRKVVLNNREVSCEPDASGHLRLALEPGRSVIRVDRKAQRVAFSAPPILYPTQLSCSKPAHVDEMLSSSKGWILFAAGPGKSDLVKLAPYVGSIECSDSRAVDAPRRENMPAKGDPRATHLDGAELRHGLRSILPAICGQTFTIDVRFREVAPAEISIVCTDWDGEGISQTIEIFDLETLDLAAPTIEISDFQQGAAARFRYDRSFRVRVCHRTGGDASVSAIIFN